MKELDNLNKLDKYLLTLGRSRMSYNKKLGLIEKDLFPLIKKGVGSNLDLGELQKKFDDLFDNLDAYEVTEWLENDRKKRS